MSNSLVEKIKNNLPNAIGVAIFFSPFLYYIYYLEQEKCKCVMTWHHNYIKYFVYIFCTFVIGILVFNIGDKIVINDNRTTARIQILFILSSIIIYSYSVYKYVGELDKTQCGCAMHDMKYLHNILYYIRYIMMAFAFFCVIPVIIIIIRLVTDLIEFAKK